MSEGVELCSWEFRCWISMLGAVPEAPSRGDFIRSIRHTYRKLLLPFSEPKHTIFVARSRVPVHRVELFDKCSWEQDVCCYQTIMCVWQHALSSPISGRTQGRANLVQLTNPPTRVQKENNDAVFSTSPAPCQWWPSSILVMLTKLLKKVKKSKREKVSAFIIWKSTNLISTLPGPATTACGRAWGLSNPPSSSNCWEKL